MFFHIWTECGDLLRKSLYSVQIGENTGQKKLRIWTFLAQWSCKELRYENPPQLTQVLRSYGKTTVTVISFFLPKA